MKKVLFVCIHNSARSQMAEELLRKYGEGKFEVSSAGIEPGVLNPVVVQILKEDENIDISAKKTNSVFDFYKNGNQFNYVITVCDEASAEKCPVFPGVTTRVHWSFEDPSAYEGSIEEKLAMARGVKTQIKSTILDFIKNNS